LPEDYDLCGSGFDQMTLDGLGLDKQRTIEYVRANKPTYMQFERWVLEQNGGSIPREKIAKHNAAIRGYNHGAELAGKMRQASGIGDAGVCDAVTLNTIEDLDALYAQVKGR
jgi:hypothetical protein